MTNPEVVVIRGTKANAPENLICGKLAEMGHFCPVEVMRKALAATRTIPEAAEVVAYDHAAIFAEARERCINDATGTCLLEHLTRVAYEHATRTIPEAAKVVALREALEEHLSEALFVLSDRLASSGILSASDAVHAAYENVVSAHAALIQHSTDTGGDESDEAYEIGKRDGYEKAVQDIDLLTGGDGEYRYVMGVQSDRHCPDAETMKQRIAERFGKAAEVVVALREALTDDECAICGKPKHRHTTNSGVGMCQIYPIFRSKRAMFDALLNSGKDGA
jgi:hypothetical protein